MTVPRDTDTRIGAFLDEGPEEMSPRLVAAIRDEVHATRRPALRLPWRTRPMSRALTVMASIAALIVAGVALFDEGDRTSPVAATPPPAAPAPAVVVASPPPDAVSQAPYPLADGEQWIAYVGEGRFIELIRPDGSGRHRLFSSGDMGHGAPDWSPDGSQVVLSRDNGSASSLWIMNADGTGGRALTPDTERCGPCLYQEWTRWSPDGRSIAFINSEVDIARTLRNDLSIVDVATGAVRTVLSSETQAFWAPSWSPDGSRIVLAVETYRSLNTAGRDGNPPLSAGLAIVDVGASESGLVPIPGLPAQPRDPAWSPDGTRIVFVDAESAIHTASPDGGDVAELYRSPAGGVVLDGPSWTPDGRLILFSSRAGDSEPVLRILDPETGSVASATGSTETEGWLPRMRPTP